MSAARCFAGFDLPAGRHCVVPMCFVSALFLACPNLGFCRLGRSLESRVFGDTKSFRIACTGVVGLLPYTKLYPYVSVKSLPAGNDEDSSISLSYLYWQGTSGGTATLLGRVADLAAAPVFSSLQ